LSGDSGPPQPRACTAGNANNADDDNPNRRCPLYGFTPLIAAVANRDVETVALLLSDPRIDVNRTGLYGMTPLMYAAHLLAPNSASFPNLNTTTAAPAASGRSAAEDPEEVATHKPPVQPTHRSQLEKFLAPRWEVAAVAAAVRFVATTVTWILSRAALLVAAASERITVVVRVLLVPAVARTGRRGRRGKRALFSLGETEIEEAGLWRPCCGLRNATGASSTTVGSARTTSLSRKGSVRLACF